MLINLHKKATTTPATRDYIRTSGKPVKTLARELNLHPNTVRKWRGRKTNQDASHRPHTMQTTLTRKQELLVIELRCMLLLSLDDLTAIVKEYINSMASRSGISRLLVREGISRLTDLIPKEEADNKKPIKTFKDYAPGFVHIDLKTLPKMPDEDRCSYLAVAIDRASRWVYFEVLPNKTAKNTQGFVERLVEKAPFKIEKILTDNGKEFTDRFTAQGERKPSGNHLFDQACKAHNIEHRLTLPYHPQTNGMVERFNGRIAELLKSTHFRSAEELSIALGHYLRLYNGQIPQKALGHICPIQALKMWHEKEPERFNFKIYNLTGLDTQFVQCIRV